MIGKSEKRPSSSSKDVRNKKAKVSKPKTSSSTPKKVDYMGIRDLTGEEKKRWANLTQPNRIVQCTKFIDLDTLVDLGMEEVMRKLFRKVGMEEFLTKQARTYAQYTYEFLTTLEKVDAKPPYITFYLNNYRQEMRYGTWGNI